MEIGIDELELSVKTAKIIKRWKPDATLSDVRSDMNSSSSHLTRYLTAKSRKELREVLQNVSEAPVSTPFELKLAEVRNAISGCQPPEQEALNMIVDLIEEIGE